MTDIWCGVGKTARTDDDESSGDSDSGFVQDTSYLQVISGTQRCNGHS